jgi:hypothetical protein
VVYAQTFTANGHVTQVYVLFADFANHQSEFVVWRPQAETYRFSGSASMIGTDLSGGVITTSDIRSGGASIGMIVSPVAPIALCPSVTAARGWDVGAAVYACGEVMVHGPYGLPSIVYPFAGARATLQD